jgi:hypothetical protein
MSVAGCYEAIQDAVQNRSVGRCGVAAGVHSASQPGSCQDHEAIAR